MSGITELPIDGFTEDDTKQAREFLNLDIAFAYIYSHAVIVAGKRVKSTCARPCILGGEVCVSPELLAELVGGHVEKTGAAFGERYISTDAIPFEDDGVKYLNACDAAEALGLSGKVYNGRLLALGDGADVLLLDKRIGENPRLAFALAALVVNEEGTPEFTKDDFAIAKRRWRERLVGSEELNDLSDPDIKMKIDAVSARCREYLESMNRGEGIPKLWGDEPPVESCELREQYGGIFSLAKGYATFGSEFYHDEKVADAIKYAFRWMNEHMYGDAELEERGWRSMKAYNWWDWRVGCGEIITDAMMITDELFTYEEKKKYLKVLEYVLDNWRIGDTQNFASGRMSLGPKTAILLEDPVRAMRAVKDYHIMLEVRLFGEGTRTDYCNYQHGFPYNMMYGLSNVNRVLKSASVLAGTPLELSSTRYYDLYLVFRYMYEAAMYRGRGFMCFYGRALSGTEETPGINVVSAILPMIGNYGPEEDRRIKHFVKSSLYSEELRAKARDLCPISLLKLLGNILNDEKISGENDLESAHAWFSADRASQHRSDYAFAVSMPSYRHPNYECINQANMRGWYTGDGALYLYTKNSPNNFDGPNFILNENIAYRIPGTTVDSRERKVVSISGGWRPKSEAVGCMNFDGKYVTAGMDYESYHCESVSDIVDKGYGGGNPYHENDLVAKKAYFMFDDECVCLGAGINSTMNSEVNTIVEHRILVKKSDTGVGVESILTDGEQLPCGYFEKRLRAHYALIEGTAGYVFPEGADVFISRYGYDVTKTEGDNYTVRESEEEHELRKTRGKPFAEIRIEHGKNPKDAAYVYAILPYADEEKTARYAKEPDFEVMSNTKECQAVREKTLGITGMVFYEAGECAGIKADKPCIVTFKENEKEFKIKVCEPTNKADAVTLEIKRALKLVCADERYTAECGDVTRLTLNAVLSVGEGYEAVFSKM